MFWSDGSPADGGGGGGLIEDGDWVGHAVSGWSDGGGVGRGVASWPLAGPTELAGQGLVHVELRGDGTAAVEVQVVLAA